MTMQKEPDASRSKLTPKQRAFVVAYCSADCFRNASAAARQAGYKGNESTIGTIAYENMQKPAIRHEIDRQLKCLYGRIELSVDKVLFDLEATKILAFSTGNLNAVLKCLDLQGKYLGMWTKKIDLSPTLDEVSTEQLLEMAKQIQDSGLIDLRSALFPEDGT